MLSEYCLPYTIGWVDRGISIVYYGEWNRNARLKMHINMVCPGKQRRLLCLEQRVCVKKKKKVWNHILILYCEIGMS